MQKYKEKRDRKIKLDKSIFGIVAVFSYFLCGRCGFVNLKILWMCYKEIYVTLGLCIFRTYPYTA